MLADLVSIGALAAFTFVAMAAVQLRFREDRIWVEHNNMRGRAILPRKEADETAIGESSNEYDGEESGRRRKQEARPRGRAVELAELEVGAGEIEKVPGGDVLPTMGGEEIANGGHVPHKSSSGDAGAEPVVLGRKNPFFGFSSGGHLVGGRNGQ